MARESTYTQEIADEICERLSKGELIEPNGFSFGGMSTEDGFVDTVSFREF